MIFSSNPQKKRNELVDFRIQLSDFRRSFPFFSAIQLLGIPYLWNLHKSSLKLFEVSTSH